MNQTKILSEIAQIITKEGIASPVFIYDYELLMKQIIRVKKIYQKVTDNYSIAYSYKTNPLLAQYIYKEDCLMQVTSLSHFEEISQFIVSNNLQNCFFNTASLTKEVVEELIESKINLIADSYVQIGLINEVAKERDQIIPIIIRIDTEIEIKGTPFGTSKAMLGFSLDEAKKLLLDTSKYESIEIIGVHNHAASQNTDLASWEKNIKKIESFLSEVEINLQILDLGGGFPIPYLGSKEVEIENIFEKALLSSLKKIVNRFPKVKLVIEPGRFLVGSTGFMIAEVTNLHDTSNPKGCVVNASMFAVFQDRFLSKMTFQPPVFLLRDPDAIGDEEYFIRGSSPASIDFFGIYKGLPELSLGDKLIFTMMGAYASSMGSSFSGVVRPKEYLLKEGELISLT